MPINWKGIKTTGNRFYDANRIAEINDSLQYLPAKQRAAVIGTIIEESGGDPLARSEKGTYQGLLQWGADRYKIQSNDARKELANQLSTLRSTINNTTDKKSWSHGGTGSGYNSFQEAYDTFHDKDAPLEDVYRAFSFGYVRPKGKEASYKNRLEVTKQVYPKVLADDVVKNSAKAVGIIGDLMHMNEWKDGGAINNRPTWDKLSMAERADVMKLAIEGGVYDLDAIRSGYNEYAKGGKIHIDPSKKGTFTAAASRHGKSVQAFASQVLAHKENYSPAMVKKANFARNASHWKHSEGGNLYPSGGFMGLLPAMPGIALTPSSNTLNIAKAAVKGAGRGISSFITGEGEPLREAGIAFIQNLNTKNKADALDAAMHSTQGGEVMGTNDLINIGIPNYFRKLTGQPMDINYTGSYLADGITPNVKRDLVNLYLKGDKTGFEDVTNNAFYNNGPDYVKYFRENYPNIKPRTYKMSSDGVPLELSEEEYAAATKNLNKNLRMKEDSRSNADNVANFNRWYKMIDGKLYAIDSDVWDFNPKDWAWEKGDEEMANSNGTPFILKAIRPVIKKKAIKRKALGGNLFSGEEGLI